VHTGDNFSAICRPYLPSSDIAVTFDAKLSGVIIPTTAAKAANLRLSELILRKTITVIGHGRDESGRESVQVILSDLRDLSELMVEEGMDGRN